MRDEALLYFYLGRDISPGIHLSQNGMDAPKLLTAASPRFERHSPGKCVAGFCATFLDLVEDLWPAPPDGWQNWTYVEWDTWFGRINGTYLVNLETLKVTQFPMYRTYGNDVPCDLSGVPGRLQIVAS